MSRVIFNSGHRAGGGSSSGDVVGPAVAVDSDVVLYDGTTGKLIKDSGMTIAQVIAAAVAAVPATPAVAQFQRVALTGGNITTASGTFVDMTGLTITLTTGNHYCLIQPILALSSSTTSNIAIDIAIDGVRQGQTFGLLLVGDSTQNWNGCFSYMTPTKLSAGSHTIKMQWYVSAGTATCRAAPATCPAILQVTEFN